MKEGIDLWIPEDPPDRPLTATEVLAFEVPEVASLPVLGREGLIMEGAANLLYSYPKTGKTELLTAMVGEWVEAGRRVLYLTEEAYPNWKVRLEVHGVDGEDLLLWYAWGQDLHRALDIIRAEQFDVLVVDTLRNTVGYLEGEGDKDVARIIHPLVTAAAGKTVLCSFHARKMPGEGGRDISGHHSLYGAFDRALALRPVEDRPENRRITVTGRCMYRGEQTFEYRQVEPGMFEVLDTLTVLEPKAHDLVCLECGDEFTARRAGAKFCGETCRQRDHRRRRNGPTRSEQEPVTDVTRPWGEELSVTRNVDPQWELGLTDQ